MNLQFRADGENPAFDLFFRQHYEIIRQWARHITGNDEGLYEDIVHDIYLRFREQNFNALDIKNVEAYIYTTLKNDFISNRRKESRSRVSLVSLVGTESIADPFFADDPRLAIKTQDQLRAVCHYACRRRRSSISASIFILRFFHGYFTFEVARIAQRSTNAVEARLLKARREVRIYLKEPTQFRKILGFCKNIPHRVNRSVVQKDLLSELRLEIFSSRYGVCLPDLQISKIYQGDLKGVDRNLLGHFVSCHDCLDRINKMLGLPLLSGRHPLETLRSNEIDSPEPVGIKAARAAA